MKHNDIIKQIVLIVFLTTTILSETLSQNTVFFYGEDGTPIQLTEKSAERYIYVETADLTAPELSSLNVYADSIKRFSPQIYKIYLKSSSIPAFESYVLNMPKIVFASKEMLCGDNSIVWPSNKIYVEISETSTIDDLEAVLTTNNIPYTEIIPHLSYDFGFYVVLSDKFNAFSHANSLYSNGTPILVSQPVFWSFLDLTNTHFSDQWGLKNTGQFDGVQGMDINVEPAWQLAEGENIVVALLDCGVELTHEDLSANMLQGVDLVGSNGNGSNSQGDYHGTSCAGIIAAVDNDKGIKGVAYKSKVLPIRITCSDSNSYPVDHFVLSRAIDYAAANSDVLSCSWGYTDFEGYSFINRSLTNAVNNGRGGKGCVVVFSAGNRNAPVVAYPASHDATIAVGAINRCGMRKSFTTYQCDSANNWGSNYGEKLSVVAPGSKILTCDLGNDYNWFSGTSAAAPHVAGVVALMLSANPNLTSQQVRNIIEQTANRVYDGNLYTYTDTTGHPNGRWTKPMGYGLVDAYAAVNAALNYELYTKDNTYDNGAEPNFSTVFDSPDIWIRRNKDGGMTHQTAYRLDTNYAYVRVHNISSINSSDGDSLIVYAKKIVTSNNPTTNFSLWPNSWDRIGGVKISGVPANSDRIFCVPVLFRPTHNLYAVQTILKSQNDPLFHSLVSDDVYNIQYNNNVSLKNMVKTNDLISTTNYGLDVNFIAQSVNGPLSSSKLRFDFGNGTFNIFDEVEVTLIFPMDLMIDWTPVSEDIKQLTANTFLVTGETVEISDVPETDVTLRYNFLTSGNSNNNIFNNHIAQYVGLDEELVGGLTIQVEKPERAANEMFTANAGNDTAVLIGTNATLHATQINEDATYRWYDKQRNFLYEGLDFTVTPSQTTEYVLEVTAESDGYRDLDIVRVSVVPGCIRSITPNPVAGNWITVSYEFAATVLNANLLIYNTATSVLVDSYNNLSGTSLDIDVTNYNSGSYSVVLMCDGVVANSKILIRQ